MMNQVLQAVPVIVPAATLDRREINSAERHLYSAVIASISHDFRSPLTSIIGAADTLRLYPDVLDADSKQDLLTTILEEAERLNRFTRHLLDMTKLEAGILVPNISPQKLDTAIMPAFSRASRLFSNNTIDIELEKELPMVNIDAVLLEQVVFNLIDNAVKYSEAGSTILIRGRHESDDTVCLTVEDEGRGIPPHQLDTIFDKFHRVSENADRCGGSGLGLAICRGFVNAIGGNITAANRTDCASTSFAIRFAASFPGFIQ